MALILVHIFLWIPCHSSDRHVQPFEIMRCENLCFAQNMYSLLEASQYTVAVPHANSVYGTQSSINVCQRYLCHTPMYTPVDALLLLLNTKTNSHMCFKRSRPPLR